MSNCTHVALGFIHPTSTPRDTNEKLGGGKTYIDLHSSASPFMLIYCEECCLWFKYGWARSIIVLMASVQFGVQITKEEAATILKAEATECRTHAMRCDELIQKLV